MMKPKSNISKVTFEFWGKLTRIKRGSAKGASFDQGPRTITVTFRRVLVITIMITLVLIVALLVLGGYLFGTLKQLDLSIGELKLVAIGSAADGNTDSSFSDSPADPTSPAPTETPTVASKPPETSTRPDTLIKKGHYISLGNYPSSEPILWIVLSVQGNEIRLFSKYVLDARIFGTSNKWRNSTLRDWLNGTFLDGAFLSAEKLLLLEDASGNRVTIPSLDDTSSMIPRSAEPTRYARDNDELPQNGTNAAYFTRTPRESSYIYFIGPDAQSGWMNPNSPCGIRPVISINQTMIEELSGNGMPNSPWHIEKISQP